MYGDKMGWLRVMYRLLRGRDRRIWHKSGNQKNEWHNERLTINSYLPYQVIVLNTLFIVAVNLVALTSWKALKGGLILTAAILSRETEKALFYHLRPRSEQLGSEATQVKKSSFVKTPPKLMLRGCDVNKLSHKRVSRCRVTSNRWDFVWGIKYWDLRTLNIIFTFFSIK